MKNSSRELNDYEHLERQWEETRISVPQRKPPSGGRMEREETSTFVHRPSLVVRILSMEMVEAKKNFDLVPSV